MCWIDQTYIKTKAWVSHAVETMLLSQSERNESFLAIINKVRADPPDTTGALSIQRTSLIGVALQMNEHAAYTPEGQYRFVQPGEHRFLATCAICNCIAVFVTSPGHTSFCAHINPPSLVYGLQELKFRRQIVGGVVPIFKTMSHALTTAFNDVENSEITVSLIGGWKLADKMNGVNIDTYFKKDKTLRTFSSVVLKCVNDALPGAKIDTSRLNRFNGVGWEDRTAFSKVTKMAQGESYTVAALDTYTGRIHLQTSSPTDMLPENTDAMQLPAEASPCFTIPIAVLEDAYMHYVETDKRMRDQNTSLLNRKIPEPVLHEYVARGVDERVSSPDLLVCG